MTREGGTTSGVPGGVKEPLRLVAPADAGWKTVAPNIQHTPGGGYRVRQRVGKKRITLGVFDTLAEAVNVQAASVEALEERGSARPTLASWMPTWFQRRAAADVRSVDSERNRAKKHILSSKIAHVPMEDLRRADVLAWLRTLETKHVDHEGQRVGWARKKAARDGANGKISKRKKRRTSRTAKPRILSHQTRRHCLNLVRGALQGAIDEGYITENPADGIKLRAEARVDDGSTVLSAAEQRRLVETVPEPVRWIVAAAVGGGWRMGEQWSMETEDVHLDARVPYVDVRYGAAGHKPTKSGRPRPVPLVGPALEAMRAWMVVRASWCTRSSALVFPTPRGAHRGKKPPPGWKDWLRKAGVTRRVRWHDLRHTCASALVSGQWGRKWSLEEVKEFLGHKSIRTTERYARFATDALMAAASEANGQYLAISRDGDDVAERQGAR